MAKNEASASGGARSNKRGVNGKATVGGQPVRGLTTPAYTQGTPASHPATSGIKKTRGFGKSNLTGR